jgi:hypothetical protein
MSKQIDLDGTYYIEIDPYNWILKKRIVAKPRKDGKPPNSTGTMREVTLGYCSSLKNALKSYTSHLEMDGVAAHAETVDVQELETILLHIEKLCKGLKLVEKDTEG